MFSDKKIFGVVSRKKDYYSNERERVGPELLLVVRALADRWTSGDLGALSTPKL